MVTANDARRASGSGAKSTVIALASLILALGLVPPRPAAAYVVKRAPAGAVVHWETAHLDVFVGAPPSGVTDAAMRNAVRSGATAWSRPSAPLLVVASTRATAAYTPGRPGVDVRVLSPWPHPSGLLATTMTMYQESTGALLDADVLINPATRFAVVSATSGANRWDVQSVVTHELGHVLGLDESDVRAATMWPIIAAGDIGPRSLAGDDRRGLDGIYDGVTLSSAGGCARSTVAAPGARPEALVVLAVLLALLALAAFRRRAAMPLSLAGAGLLFFYLPSVVWSAEATAPPRAADTEPDLTRWAPFAGATMIAPARVEGAFVGEDGIHRTRVVVGDDAFEVLGGCVDGICMRFGDESPPADGEEVLFAPATGAWAHVRDDVAWGGALGPGPALRLSRGAI